MAWNPGNYSAYNGYQSMPTFMAPQSPLQAPQGISAPQVTNNPQACFRCVPVTSYAQAEAFQIPFDGSTTYFVDTSNGKIYAKTFDFNTGTAVPVTYVRENAAPEVRFATIDDLNALREELTTKSKKAVKKDDSDE